MGQNKRTPRQQMRYFWIGPRYQKIRARTERAAIRKYLRGSCAHDYLVRDLELDNPGNPRNDTPGEALKIWRMAWAEAKEYARRRLSAAALEY